MNSERRRYLAEAVGTFVLVFTGCGSAVLAGNQIGIFGIAVAFGLAVLTMIYAIGPISGCHINPSVTLALWVTRKFQGRYVIGYIVAQVIGGTLGAALLLLIAKGGEAVFDPAITGLASTGYGPHSPGHYSLGAGFLTEVVLTALLVLTILGATDVKAPVGFAGVAIGLVVTLAILVGIPVTGCSINPARSIATALVAGGWALRQVWLFIVAPPIGALLAAAIYEVLRERVPMIPEREAVQATIREQADRYAADSDDEPQARTP